MLLFRQINTEQIFGESVCRLCECPEDNPRDGCEHVFVRKSSWIALMLRKALWCGRGTASSTLLSDFVWLSDDYVRFHQVTEEEAVALRRASLRL